MKKLKKFNPEETKFLESVKKVLEEMGYDTTKKSFTVHSDSVTQCFARGPFAGYSVGTLLRGFCKMTGKKYKEIHVPHL